VNEFSVVVTFSLMIFAGVGLMLAAMMNRRRFRKWSIVSASR
jgi:hypothetical protein